MLPLALALLARGGDLRLSPPERALVTGIAPCTDLPLLNTLQERIRAGDDPLGEAFCTHRSAEARRRQGQVLTPAGLVRAMTLRAQAESPPPARIVEAGAGTGRFLLACGRVFPKATLIGIEQDPLCALLLRANLQAAGLAGRAQIILGDYRDCVLPPAQGRTLHIGNPPYVRHHNISTHWKDWYVEASSSLGQERASKLAGLHLHFFVKTALLAQEGDLAIFLTAAEWLDTGYGHALRSLLLGRLGGLSVHVIDARTAAFPGTLSTAAITVFAPGRAVDGLRFEEVGSVEALGALTGGQNVSAWPHHSSSRGINRVGDFFRVSRGQATGMNKAWLAGNGPTVPARFLFPCITAAKEVFAAAETGRINNDTLLKIIDLPNDLSCLDKDEAAQVEAFLRWARDVGADQTYLARHRSPWWSVRLREPAPIICTYMARRPPVFVRNEGVRLLNVAHGLYPKLDLTEDDLRTVVVALNDAFRAARGRVYAGGLIKFEPRAVEAVEFDWQPSAHRMDT